MNLNQLLAVQKQLDSEVKSIGDSIATIRIAQNKYKNNALLLNEYKDNKEDDILVPICSTL